MGTSKGLVEPRCGNSGKLGSWEDTLVAREYQLITEIDSYPEFPISTILGNSGYESILS